MQITEGIILLSIEKYYQKVTTPYNLYLCQNKPTNFFLLAKHKYVRYMRYCLPLVLALRSEPMPAASTANHRRRPSSGFMCNTPKMSARSVESSISTYAKTTFEHRLEGLQREIFQVEFISMNQKTRSPRYRLTSKFFGWNLRSYSQKFFFL